MSKDSVGTEVWDIGVDIGGTFTDVVCYGSEGACHILKVPTHKDDPSLGVLSALERLARECGVNAASIRRFVHGTTVATNAVLEQKGGKVGLITTRGFRDVLEIGRQSRRSLYDLNISVQVPIFLAPRYLRKEVNERIGPHGETLLPLDEKSLVVAAEELVAEGVEALAIVFLFSYKNCAHECRARDIIQERYPNLLISLSHQVDPQYREYERTITTAFDAYVKPGVYRYIAALENRLETTGCRAPLQIMQSRGAATLSTVARERPVQLFLSGPAGGVVGARHVSNASGFTDVITIDIGGTSADIALIRDGAILLKREGRIGVHYTRTPMVDVTPIGSGGGSIAYIDTGGALRVGPNSAGSEPGPACYNRGGSYATVTDASLVLGFINPDNFAGGMVQLDIDKAKEAIRTHVAIPLGMSVQDAAVGIHKVLNVQMSEGIRAVSVRRGIDPRKFTLVPLGGAGTVHATALATNAGMKSVLIPQVPGVLAAVGVLDAPTVQEASESVERVISDLDDATLYDILARLEEKAGRRLAEESVGDKGFETRYYADVCYVGQSYTLEVAFDRERNLPEKIYNQFLRIHKTIYGHAVKSAAKVEYIRCIQESNVSLRHPNGTFASYNDASKTSFRDVRFLTQDKKTKTPVLDRKSIRVSQKLVGPMIIEQSDTTIIIEPGWAGEMDQSGNIILREVDGERPN